MLERHIPFIDLAFQYNLIKEDIDAEFIKVVLRGHFSEGREVQEFEMLFAEKHKSSYCVALNSGTSALHAILSAFQIGGNHEVILPSNTCFPTAEAVCMTGATPVFIDCEPEYFNMDPQKIESAITSKTRAIIAVHLYGQPVQMEKIGQIAGHHKLLVVEDCAQAHLATYQGKCVGNLGVAGAFSFYPTKNLGAYGEGGAVVTGDMDLAERIKAFKNHGSFKKNIHEFAGHNYRMDSLQAAILSAKLKYLEQWTMCRADNANLYYNFLADIKEIILPAQHPEAKHVFHQFVIRTKKRGELQQYLSTRGIETAIHYPVPCHLQPALRHLGYSRGSLPVSEKLAEEILSLPVAEHVSNENVEYICKTIKRFFQNKAH